MPVLIIFVEKWPSNRWKIEYCNLYSDQSRNKEVLICGCDTVGKLFFSSLFFSFITDNNTKYMAKCFFFYCTLAEAGTLLFCGCFHFYSFLYEFKWIAEAKRMCLSFAIGFIYSCLLSISAPSFKLTLILKWFNVP